MPWLRTLAKGPGTWQAPAASGLGRYIEKRDELKPGKYRVRVKFRYDKFAAVSEWVPFEIPAK